MQSLGKGQLIEVVPAATVYSLNIFKLLSKHPFKSFFFQADTLQKAADISREIIFCLLVHFSVQFLSVIRLFCLRIAMVIINCTPAITAKVSHDCQERRLRSDNGGKICSHRWDVAGLIL